MVNVGLRGYLWDQKPEDQKVQRELWNLNGATYEGYRAYIRYVKDNGWPESGAGPDPSPSQLATADSGLLDPSLSRLPTTESLPTEASGALTAHASELSGLYSFSSMRRVFQEAAGSAVHLVKFGRFTADLLAFAAADGCVYVAGATEERGGVLQALRGHTGRVADLDWSQDNAFLLTCGRDGDLCLWHVDTGSLVRKWEQGAGLWPCPLACCRFHPVNQNLLFVGTVGGEVVVLNSSTGLPVSRVTLPSTALGGAGAACLDVLPTRLAVADSRGGLHLYSCLLQDGRLRAPQLLCSAPPARGRSHEPAAMECVPHSQLVHGPAVLQVDCHGRILVYRVHEKGQHQARLELRYEAAVGRQSSHKVRGALCPAVHVEQPEVVAMGGEDCCVHLYDVSRAKREPVLLTQLQGHRAPVLDVSWAFDESLLASSDAQGTVIVWKRDPAHPATPPPGGAAAGAAMQQAQAEAAAAAPQRAQQGQAEAEAARQQAEQGWADATATVPQQAPEEQNQAAGAGLEEQANAGVAAPASQREQAQQA